MLKIKQIEFIKVVYDESLSHNIFSIANITFSNYPPIHGALLYWQKNKGPEPFTEEGDYKFFYDMANVTHFASVKFPKYVRLTRDQKQELAYILLEERGSVGSYSFSTYKGRHKSYQHAKKFEQLSFPEGFDPQSIPGYIKSVITQMDLQLILHDYPHYDPTFIEQYVKWRYETAALHPNDLIRYFPYVHFGTICLVNPYLSESFLIEHLPRVDFEALAHNYAVLKRLSEPFRAYMYTQLEPELAQELREFLTFDVEDEPDEYLQLEEEEPQVDFEFFEYDRGTAKWPGAEHLVKGIPSLASQRYDQLGYAKYTNKEMDERFKDFNDTQRMLCCHQFDLHWLHRYRNELDWSRICKYNPYLTVEFLSAHLKYIDFEALGQNTVCELNNTFVEAHLHRFNLQKVVPLIIRHLTEDFYTAYKDQIIVDSELLHKYGDLLDDEQFLLIQNRLEP